jgi:hypothetical protein
LREDHRLRVFENRVLRRIFGPKREGVTGEWKRLHNEEVYSSPNVFGMITSRIMRWAEHVAHMGTGEVNKGMRLLGRQRRTCENNIKMALQEMEW